MHELLQQSLDPTDWNDLRAQGHRMLNDMFDHMESLRYRPVWQPIPHEKRARFSDSLPQDPAQLETVHASFMQDILPYSIGNAHPGFMGWVQGGGTAVGMLAEMLTAGLNANVGGRDQMPLEVERQLVQWMRELFGFPAGASGLFVTGSSMANLISVLVARTAALGRGVRNVGVGGSGQTQQARLCAYTSAAAHGCIAQAMDLTGIGVDALRVIPVDARHRMDIGLLERAIAGDRRAGFQPFFLAGTAGTVDIGAIDDLVALAAIAKREAIWFHVDGAYAALGMLASDIALHLQGIECADSIAMDFHKWAQVQYDAGFVLVRDGAMHEATFAAPAAYLSRHIRGMAAGSPWPCDFGPDLSRNFKALKTWFTIKTYGAKRLGEVMSGTCALARYLERCIESTPDLELLAPVSLNIVCFGFKCSNPDSVNAEIVVLLQEAGIVAPSTTTIDGRLVIRAAFVNHRTSRADVDRLIAETLRLGARLARPLRAQARAPKPASASAHFQR
ncbi:MAG: aspartate aminotransferase family protein [Burkholderiaceae bacterium]